MASSETEVANLALAHLGQNSITDIDSESSQEAAACRRFYDHARDEMLRRWPWTFAKRRQVLALVEEDPTDEWGYSYRWPSDCLFPRRIVNGDRNPTKDTVDKYLVESDTSGKLILCDVEDAELEYTARVEDVGLFPADFTLALSYKLAFYIAPFVTGGDPFDLQRRMIQFAEAFFQQAAAGSANEDRPDVPPESEFISGR